ncbi:class D sortase [Bacillus sonorensis]|uniref:class D sortase n=1 Tax=Bacillus sonorensis TaxID=119858 RepID=UPI00398ADF75
MRKMRKISIIIGIILILVGVVFGGSSLWELYETKAKTSESLKEAKVLVNKQEKHVEDTDTNHPNTVIEKKERESVRTSDDSKSSESKSKNLKTKEKYTPKTGDVAGLLTIPAINAELPIVEGTDPNDLAKGVGHYKGSYYPDQNGQIVLSGHRDTVFRRAGELRKGDILRVDTGYGGYDYVIKKMKIVSKDDDSIITLQHEKEELILTTCYPFSYIGDAPDRYIIYAYRK